MPKEKDGCAKPAKGPIVEAPSGEAPVQAVEVTRVQAKAGKPAPDFEANAYVKGEGFRTVRLSEHRGNWIVLCFYPGDFTFV